MGLVWRRIRVSGNIISIRYLINLLLSFVTWSFLTVWRNISSTMTLRLRVLIHITSFLFNLQPEIDFESSRSSAKSESWDESICSAASFFSFFPTWQYYREFVIVMNVWNLSYYSSVTCLSTLWDWSCKITDRPECQVCQVASNENNLLFAIDFLQLSWWDRLKLLFFSFFIH